MTSATASVPGARPLLQNDHTVYVLGAGFSADAGMPLVRTFLQTTRDCSDWLEESGRSEELKAVGDVFAFLQRAAAAGYRTTVDAENIEELFCLASALGDSALTKSMVLAIAATLDFCRERRPPLKAYKVRSDVAKTLTWTPASDQSGGSDGYVRFKRSAHDWYTGVMLGKFAPGGGTPTNTFITFNYDLVLEDACRGLRVPVDYGISADRLARTCGWMGDSTEGGVRILKLHGSVNWSPPEELGGKIAAHNDYSPIQKKGTAPVLIPPTWRKDFSQQFADVWSQAVQAIREATRICVIGFSMPETDVHFRYLLSAGLQDNISLRKIFFIDPLIGQIQDRVLRVLREDLLHRNVLEMHACTLRQAVQESDIMTRLGRMPDAAVLSWQS